MPTPKHRRLHDQGPRRLQRLRRLAFSLLALLILSCSSPGNGPTPAPGTTSHVPIPGGGEAVTCPAYDASKLPPLLPNPGTPGGPTTGGPAPVAPGTIPGSFSVSASGQATYSFDLEMPPGRVGMQPHVSISYDSSGPLDGPLGVGFSLHASSSITRCPANMSQDGVIEPVRNTWGDHLCLDGLRLVPVSLRGEVAEYRTFPDTFAKVLEHADAKGPAWFEVYTKDGHILKYGSTTDSKAMATGGAISEWWLATESDRRGNAVDYTYLNDVDSTDGHTQEIRPLQFFYTRHGNQPATRVVNFLWTPSNSTTTYASGLALTHNWLLQSVSMEAETGIVRTYSFSYEVSLDTSRLRLRTATECTDASGCKPTTTFTWGNTGSTLTTTTTPKFTPDEAQRQEQYDPQTKNQWLLADVNGDGLEDIVFVWWREDNSGLDDWYVSINDGPLLGFAPAEPWATAVPHLKSHSVDLGDGYYCSEPCHEKYTLSAADLDQDGNTDIFVDVTNPLVGPNEGYHWMKSVPTNPPGQRFVMQQTSFRQVEAGPVTSIGPPIGARFVRLGDINGDGVADLIECTNPTYQGIGFNRNPGTPEWRVHFWVPSVGNSSQPGFDPNPTPIQGTSWSTTGIGCGAGTNLVYVADVDGAAGSEIVMPWEDDLTYAAARWNGSAFEVVHLGLRREPLDEKSGRTLHFLDLNGDGLSDVMYTGWGSNGCSPGNQDRCDPGATHSVFGWTSDAPFMSINNGNAPAAGPAAAFSTPVGTLPASEPLEGPGGGDAGDWFGNSATPIDFDGDGRMDLMLPVEGSCDDGTAQPCITVLLTSPSVRGFWDPHPTTAEVPASNDSVPFHTHIKVPWEQQSATNLFPYFLPKVIDAYGDGRQEIIAPNWNGDGTFVIYKYGGVRDVLTSISDGLNPLSPGDPGFVPTVSIQYGTLVDDARRVNATEESTLPNLYLSQSDPNNDCAYPRSCVVGSGRVVTTYQLNNGANEQRQFHVRYRDGRYHRLGRGFLGFGERIVIDNDRQAGTAEFYDNMTWDPAFNVYPYAGHVVDSWKWSPASLDFTNPTQVELEYGLDSYQHFQTVPGTYFVLPMVSQATRKEGTYQTGAETLLEYVEATEYGPAPVLSHMTRIVFNYDLYGNVLKQDSFTDNVDLYDTVTRSDVSNDPNTWLIGLVHDEARCSTSLGITQCRDQHRDYNQYGEVTKEINGDPGDAGTQLTAAYGHDVYGNVVEASFDDAFGHHREACVSYEPSGTFPYATRNTLGHTVLTGYDLGLGVPTGVVDPNGLQTRVAHDGFGRVTEVLRPDGTWTQTELSRNKNGGSQHNWWAITRTTTEKAGPTTVTLLDAMLRPASTTKQVSDIYTCGAAHCASGLTLTQTNSYDFFGRLFKATSPWMVGDSLTNQLADTYDYDLIGRLVSHTEPWGRKTTYRYFENVTYAKDWLGSESREVDGLGRVIVATDKIGGTTQTLYGPFSEVRAVTRLSSETTTTYRDAYGRVYEEVDPDRGTTKSTYDGFDDVLTMDDADQRHYEYNYDGIGRLVERDDVVTGQTLTTTWTYDTAANGIGLLASVTSPQNHVDTFAYDALSRRTTHTLTFGDTGQSFSSTLQYDTFGRVLRVKYPAVNGTAPFVVQYGYDDFSNVVDVRQWVGPMGGGTEFWKLEQLDGAGRAAREALGNGVVTTRAYSPASGRVEHIGAAWFKSKALHATLQDLGYTYDEGLRMSTRSDGLQTGLLGPLTEIFQHDPLDRVTCAEIQPPILLPGRDFVCHQPIVYEPNGNIKHKWGVGLYEYDATHPHAVHTTASTQGTDTYQYDAVGNQTARPGAQKIEYTPYDLPSRYHHIDGFDVDLDYDGNQHRIRKHVGPRETVYFDDLYERVDDLSTAVHKFYVGAGSSTAVVTLAEGGTPSTAYVLTEALGSTDVIADENGAVVERRSYDVFGAQRNSDWTNPNPPRPTA